jgi:hypothetical protein
VQIKKELTISRSDVDKMSVKEIFTLFYSCNFTAGKTVPQTQRKILFYNRLSADSGLWRCFCCKRLMKR